MEAQTTPANHQGLDLSSKSFSPLVRERHSSGAAVIAAVAGITAALLGGCGNNSQENLPHSERQTSSHTYHFPGTNFPKQLSNFRGDHPELNITGLSMVDKSRGRVWEYIVLTENVPQKYNFSSWGVPSVGEKTEYLGNGIVVFNEKNKDQIDVLITSFESMNPNWKIKSIAASDISDGSVWQYVAIADGTPQ